MQGRYPIAKPSESIPFNVSAFHWSAISGTYILWAKVKGKKLIRIRNNDTWKMLLSQRSDSFMDFVLTLLPRKMLLMSVSSRQSNVQSYVLRRKKSEQNKYTGVFTVGCEHFQHIHLFRTNEPACFNALQYSSGCSEKNIEQDWNK